MNERVDDILAEMRRHGECLALCERLDAALERERDEWRSRLKDAHEMGDGFLKTANHALDLVCHYRHLAEKYMGVGAAKEDGNGRD